MKFRTMDDITREREKRERETQNESIANDVDDIINKVQKKLTLRNQKTKKRSLLGSILWVIFLVLAFVVIVNFILLNVWALKFFIKSFFG